MAGNQITGLASGLDTNALIESESEATRRTRVQPLRDKLTQLGDQDAALATLKTRLTALQSSLQSFRSISGGGVSKIASASDETVLTATPGNGAQNGTYAVTVDQLATTGRLTFPPVTLDSDGIPGAPIVLYDPYDDLTDPVAPGGGGTISVTLGTKIFDIVVTASTTVSQFYDLLANATSNDVDATALTSVADVSLVNVGSTADPKYRLVVSTKGTGAVNGAVGFADGGADLYAEDVAGVNAIFDIAGIGNDIERETNNINDVLTSLALTLRDTGTSQVTVGTDTATTVSRIKAFMSAFNDVVAFVNENNLVERTEDSKGEISNIFGPLAKITVDNDSITSLKNALSAATANSGTSINILADLGIITDASAYDSEGKTGGGTLKFYQDTETTTSSAIASEPDAVSDLLQALADAIAHPTTGVVATYVNANQLFDITINSDRDQISDLNRRVADAEKAIAAREEILRAQYGRLESLMGRLNSQSSQLTSALAGLGNN